MWEKIEGGGGSIRGEAAVARMERRVQMENHLELNRVGEGDQTGEKNRGR